MDDDDGALGGTLARGQYAGTVGILHVERVEQGQLFQLHVDRQAGAGQRCGQVAVGKAQGAVQFVVMLVESAAGGDDAQCHGRTDK